jgi:hypothetical protein
VDQPPVEEKTVPAAKEIVVKEIEAKRGVRRLVRASADLVLAAQVSAPRASADLALVVALADLALVGPALADQDSAPASVLRENVRIAMTTTIVGSVNGAAIASETMMTTLSNGPNRSSEGRPAFCPPS